MTIWDGEVEFLVARLQLLSLLLSFPDIGELGGEGEGEEGILRVVLPFSQTL